MHATTINALQPIDNTQDLDNPTFAQEAMESFLYNHSFTKYDDLAI